MFLATMQRELGLPVDRATAEVGGGGWVRDENVDRLSAAISNINRQQGISVQSKSALFSHRITVIIHLLLERNKVS